MSICFPDRRARDPCRPTTKRRGRSHRSARRPSTPFPCIGPVPARQAAGNRGRLCRPKETRRWQQHPSTQRPSPAMRERVASRASRVREDAASKIRPHPPSPVGWVPPSPAMRERVLTPTPAMRERVLTPTTCIPPMSPSLPLSHGYSPGSRRRSEASRGWRIRQRRCTDSRKRSR